MSGKGWRAQLFFLVVSCLFFLGLGSLRVPLVDGQYSTESAALQYSKLPVCTREKKILVAKCGRRPVSTHWRLSPAGATNCRSNVTRRAWDAPLEGQGKLTTRRMEGPYVLSFSCVLIPRVCSATWHHRLMPSPHDERWAAQHVKTSPNPCLDYVGGSPRHTAPPLPRKNKATDAPSYPKHNDDAFLRSHS